MARRTRQEFSKLPKDTHDALADASKMSCTVALRMLKRRRVSVVTPLSRIRELTQGVARKHNVKFKITTSRRIFHKKELGQAFLNEVYLHPLLQYRTEHHVKDVIGHEMDHVKVARRIHNNKVKRMKQYGLIFVGYYKNGDEKWFNSTGRDISPQFLKREGLL